MSLWVMHCLQLKIFRKERRNKSWQSNSGDPSRVSPMFRFFRQKLNAKRPQLSNKKQFGPGTDSSSGLVAMYLSDNLCLSAPIINMVNVNITDFKLNYIQSTASPKKKHSTVATNLLLKSNAECIFSFFTTLKNVILDI